MRNHGANWAIRNRRRMLIVGDSLAAPRLTLKYRDTWVCRLKDVFPDHDIIALVDGGRTTKFLALNPTRNSDGTIEYDRYSLELFEPSIVIISLGIVDCAPRLFSRRESFFVDRIPRRLRTALVVAVKRLRSRATSRAYVSAREFEENVRQYLERCRDLQVDRVIVIGIATPDTRGLSSNAGLGEAAARYNEIYKRLCDEFSFARFVDPLQPREEISPLYVEDGYHLSVQGHAAVYHSVAAAVGLGAPMPDASTDNNRGKQRHET